jgi:hypothetical protein
LKGKKIWVTCVVLVIAALLVIQFYPLRMLSIFSVSQINLQQQGYEDSATHEWKNSYWVIALVTDTFENYKAVSYTFNNEEAQGANTIGEKTLVVNSEIKVTVIPEKPYYERSMQYVTYTVYPKTYGTYMNKISTALIGKLGEDTAIPELKVTVLQFTTESWKLYTPFTIQLYKNEVLKDEKHVNTLGGTETIILTADPGETLRVQNLGKLGTGLGEPDFGDVIKFDDAHIFKIEGNILAEIQYDKDTYSYSRYWFGGGPYYYAVSTYGSGPVIRWPDGTPAHYWLWGGVNQPMYNSMFSGVYRADTTLDYWMKPYAADIFNDKAADKPVTGSPFGYSLVNYLANLRGHNLYTLSDFDEYNQGIEIKDNKMRIYLPLSSVNNVVTVWISTELADAIVYQPVPAKGVITAIDWLGSGEVSHKDIAIVAVKQDGKDGGRITITASGISGYPMSVSPITDSVILKYGESHTFFFTVKNLGTGTAQSGTLRFTLTNDLGEQTDQKTLSFKLQPQIGDQTILTVNLYDKDGFKPSGILVTVNYGVNSKSGVTSNGYVTFDLGTYKGGVSIATQETDAYMAASTTATVSAGQNNVYLEVQKKGQLSIWDLFVEWVKANMTAIALMSALAVAVVGLVAYRRR